MPTYNRRGDITGGVDFVVWIKRRGEATQVIAENAAGPAWTDDVVALYQANSFSGSPFLQNSHGENVCGSPASGCGANALVGGAGRWQAFRASSPSVIFGSYGELSGAGKLAMSRTDGTLVYCEQYVPESRDIAVVFPWGTVLRTGGSRVAYTACADHDGAGWFHGGWFFNVWQPGAVTTVRLPYETYGGRLFRRADGSLWLVYSSGGTPYAICHSVDNPSVGYLFGTPDAAFNPDVVEIGGQLYGCWSTTQGERPEHIRESQLTDWGVLPRGVVVEPPPEQAWPSQYTSAFPRKIWSFSFHGYTKQYGYTDDPVGNCTWVGNTPEDIRAAAASTGMPMVMGLNDLAGVPYDEVASQVIAWWQSGADLEALSESVRKAKSLPTQMILAYLDRRGWPSSLPVEFSRQVIPMLQCYRQQGETLSEFDRAIRRDIEACLTWTPYVSLCVRMDDGYGGSNTWPVEEVLKSVPLYDQWAHDYPVMCLAFFSDRRGHGMAYYPSLRAEAKRLVRQNPVRPNRYDYWQHGDLATVVKNKLGQSVEMIQLSQEEKAYLLHSAPTPPEPEPPDPPPSGGEIPNHLDIVLAQAEQTPLTPSSTLEEIFKFTQRVAWTLQTRHYEIGDPPGMDGGLLLKPGGENIYTCQGETYSISRVCYPDGRIYKILTDAGPGGTNGPAWNPEEPIDPARYHPATDPSGGC